MVRIGQAAAQLNVSPSTVRRLSDRFSGWLGGGVGEQGAPGNGRRAPRTYSDADVATLRAILEWKSEGQSDEQIEQRLAAPQPGSALAVRDGDGSETALTRPAAAALGQALNQLAEAQQALITSQQAHRDLLNAVVGDALTLKDENDRLRKRLRMVEEEMSRLKESDWNHRLALEERMGRLEQEQHKPHWWERLRGR